MPTRTLTPQEDRALMQRHAAAMRLIHTREHGVVVDPYELLLAVVCPSDEQLRALELDVCTQAA